MLSAGPQNHPGHHLILERAQASAKRASKRACERACECELKSCGGPDGIGCLTVLTLVPHSTHLAKGLGVSRHETRHGDDNARDEPGGQRTTQRSDEVAEAGSVDTGVSQAPQ